MNTLFNQPLRVMNAGLHSFADNIQHAEGSAIALNQQPPTQDDIDAGLDLASLLHHPLVENANQIAMAHYLETQLVLVDVMLAKEAIPAMTRQKRTLRSGPPIAWEEMCGPIKEVIIGAMLYGGQVTSQQGAENQMSAGGTDLAPCHHYHAVGLMADTISPSMPLWVVESKTDGHHTFGNFSGGPGRVLRFGTNNDEVLDRLAWMRDELAPTMKTAIAQHGELEFKPLMAQTLHMEDKVHNHNVAATGLLAKHLFPTLLACSLPQEHVQRVVASITGNDHFFLNLSIAACKAMVNTTVNVPFGSMVTVMVRNGVNFGIRLSGTGDRWFQTPANTVEGLFFPGFDVDDAAADLDNSAITETADVGGFAMTSSPTIVKFVGGTLIDTTNNSHQMQAIILGGNPTFTLPALNLVPTAAGVGARKVTDRGTLSVINTSTTHKQAGIGQIGTGITATPMACFVATVRVLAEIVAKENHHG